MNKENKLHLGCGSVYLYGYTNIDAVGISPDKRPELLQTNATTIDKYFKHPYRIIPFGEVHEKSTLVDKQLDVKDLSIFSDNSIDEILSVNLINHLRFQDFSTTMKEWHRVLKPNGKLIIDIDDVVKMSQNVVEAKTKEEFEKALRYLYCHSRDQYDVHHWGYTEEYLKQLLEPIGFNFEWRNDEYIHHDADYPRFLVCFTKASTELNRSVTPKT